MYKSTYRYCVVPKCTNTTVKTPHKLFLHVPRDEKLRKKWCSIIKTDVYSSTSTRHCCEDHFDLESDMENYTRVKLMGGFLKLKQGVFPHKFECWQSPKKHVQQRAVVEKRRKLELIDTILNTSIEERYCLEKPIEFIACADPKPSEEVKGPEDPLFLPHSEDDKGKKIKTPKTITKSKSMQVNLRPKMCDQMVQTKRIKKPTFEDKMCQTMRIRKPYF